MSVKISKKIVGYSVVTGTGTGTGTGSQAAAAPGRDTPAPAAAPRQAEVIHMHEKVERPDTLLGETYKVKSPLFEHSLYVTINDIVLNAGTEHEVRRPFEIFINSKNMEHFQWIVALTRIMSAVFRKGGDVTFLVEEMKAVFDPRGGYFKAGGVYMPSIVAEIGSVVEQHLKRIGLLHDPEMTEEQRALIAAKRAAYEQSQATAAAAAAPATETPGGEGAEGAFPPGAMLCTKCSTHAMVVLDGCETCLNCGWSKCG